MGFDSIALGIILVGGLFTACAGINFYRYAVIIMSAAGGYALGKIICDSFLNGMVGEGVLRESDTGAVDSFVMAVCILGFAALGYALYQIMAILVSSIGAAFFFAKLAQALMGADMLSLMIGAFAGLVIGALIAMLAIKFEGIVMIIFTALAGGRIAGYAAAFFLRANSIGALIAKPCMGLYSARFSGDVIRLSLALELMLVIAVIGVIIQLVIRDD